jgi:polysaccharide biosynthesis protein PslG
MVALPAGGRFMSRCHLVRAALLLSVLAFAGVGADEPKKPAERPAAPPWGISSSASSFKNHAEWLPKMAAAGVATVRLFPEWRQFEPAKGTWQWDRSDALVKAAADNKIEINAILMGSTPASKKAHAFPIDDLDGWSNYVSTVVKRYGAQVRYWEVWNEGNGGFNDDRHTTSDYAKLALATYAAAKQADPNAKVGLTVASFDAPYLNQAIRAMAKAGKPNSFDYLCIHPYEIADGLADADGEIPFLWMAHTLRDVLKASAPDRADAEIWITEVARRVEKRKGHAVTEADAARALVKIYTMAIAQGIQRTQWFEAQDPVGEDQGFGLLNRDGSPRATYKALKLLTARLGAVPKYQGWLALGWDSRGYGFVFQSEAQAVLVAWMPAGQTDRSVSFRSDVEVVDPLRGAQTSLPAGQALPLTDSPVFVVGVPADLVKEARGNATRNFPWGGDYSAAKAVRCAPGEAGGNQGIFQVGRDATPTIKFADGSTGILVQGDIGHPVAFYVHPSFANFQTSEYYIRVTVRRVAPGNAGMNLLYEVADSQGRTPYKNREQWYGVANEAGWQTHTWHVTDACFSKMWANDFTIRPEQSVPFVIGKVEVSTVPFK